MPNRLSVLPAGPTDAALASVSAALPSHPHPHYEADLLPAEEGEQHCVK